MSKLSTQTVSEELSYYCRRVYERGLSPGTSGNISIRDGEHIFITPKGACLGEVESPDVVKMLMDTGSPIESQGAPSSEWVIHRALYQCRSDVRAVIHAHPTKASALAAMHRTIDQPLIAEVVYHLGDIPLVPYVLPGTRELAQAIVEHGSQARAMILANHGVITLGATLREAFFYLELLESQAEVYILANLMPGGPKPLAAEEVGRIKALRHGSAPVCSDY